MVTAVLDDGHLDRFRVAMRFSLWAWAIYWPGGGLLLLLGGLDVFSIVVTLVAVAGFILVLRSGALKTDASRNLKQFALERPIYLVALLFAFAIVAPALSIVENIGLRVFSAAYLGGLIFAGVRLAQHLKAEGVGVRASGADQVYVLLGMTGFAAFLVFADAWLPMFGTDPIAGNSFSIAAVNWLNLLYPPLLLLAVRPFRDPLRNPLTRAPPSDDEPAPTRRPVRVRA
jgi:hypothetical protein